MCLGGGGKVPTAPDTSAGQAASGAIGQAGAQAGADQLAGAKTATAGQTATTANVQGQLNPLIGQQAGAGSAASDQFSNQTLGGLNQQLSTAQNYGSQAGMDQASAAARAQTGQAYNAARLNNQRQLGSYGVDPSQMKSGALNLNANLQQAGAVGNAGYNAGQQRQLTGMGLTSQALGQNLQAAGVGQGYTSGANATGSNIVGMGNQTIAGNSAALTAPSTMMNTGLAGYGQQGNMANQQFANQMTSYNASQAGNNSLMSGLGSVAGMAAMAMMADGGAIPGRKAPGAYCNGGMYADGGPSRPAAMVPVAGVPAIQAGDTYNDPNAGGFGAGLGSGAKAAGPDMVGAGWGAIQQHQVNGAMGKANAQIANDPQMQQLQQSPQMATPTFNMPGYANGGAIPKRTDYGNPAVNPSCGVPPQVGIPGPWVAANGGTPPGFVAQGMSDGTGIDDQVPAKISVGEYVVPADVVHAKGKEFFDKLLQRYHTPAQQQRQQMGMQ